ncbi:HlyD family secretion protein [Pontiellaceae bacterium B12219]|nr:HlyD family secretion protein [Pontiellaceae bacterium B12219]
MELIITIAYIFLIRLIFFDYKLLKYNLFWKIFTIGLWCFAVLTEVVFLGQLAPYSKTMFVQSYVIQMAPEYGGLVKEVYIQPNQRVKKGDPLFQMDPSLWQERVNVFEAKLAAADTTVAQLSQAVFQAQATLDESNAMLLEAKVNLEEVSKAAENNAVSKLRLEEAQEKLSVKQAEVKGAEAALKSAQIALDSKVGDKHSAVAEVLAELNQFKYNLEKTIIRAPSDGYVANHQLYPGSFIRLKQPVMAFVNTEDAWLVATVPQRGIQHLREGDKAEVALEMYPGKVFDAVVENVVWAAGSSQGIPSGTLPNVGQMQGSELFTVRLRMKNVDPDYPLKFGASGLAAMYSTDTPDFLKLLRQIEIQSESYLNYLYNPFK